MYKTLLFIAFAFVAASAYEVDYNGHMVIQVVPETQAQLDLLVSLQKEGHDFWDGPNPIGHPSDIQVSPDTYYHVARSLGLHELSHKIKISDVGKRIEEEQKEIVLRRALQSGKAFDFTNYHSLAEIEAFLVELSNTNSHVKLESIGKTYSNHDIWMTTISSGTGSTNKPVMFFDCTMHAREWVSPASCLWIINELATKYGSDSEITALLDYADWLISPVINPDGYNYTWTSDRLWRKNRQPTPGAVCIGTDPNRNFDINHCGPGASTLPCNDAFCGPSPFSTQEAAAMRDVLVRYRGRVKASLSIHAYSQYWMCPYGYTAQIPADYDEQYRVMKIAVEALTATYGTRYTYGSIINVIYQASGSTIDWTYDKQNVKYSYALELRDTGANGFLLPANQILPTATELFNGLKAMTFAIRDAPQLRKH